MQDRYPDDVGQFVKVALLRWLVSVSPYGRAHRLGVLWLHEPGGGHRIDGDHLAYLHSTADADEDLRSLDPDLYDLLRRMAGELGRPVSVRETYRALPADTVRFDRPLRLDDRDDLAARLLARQRWFHEASVAVSPCSLVFLDSDGRRAGSEERSASSNVADTGVLMSELSQLLERRHSVVTHQLVGPTPSLARQASAHLAGLHDALGVEPMALTWESHGVGRMFTLVPHDRHGSDLRDRVGALQLSRWGDDLRVHRWAPTLVAV